jgi:hypothetical protein
VVQRHADAQPVLEAQVSVELGDRCAAALDGEAQPLGAARLALGVAMAEAAVDLGDDVVVERGDRVVGAHELDELEHVAGPGDEALVAEGLESPAARGAGRLGVRDAPAVDRVHAGAAGRELGVGV